MVSAFFSATPEEEDLLVAALWETGTAGIIEEAGGLRAFFSDESGLDFALEAIGRKPERLRTEEDTDWVQVSQHAFPPVLVGNRLYLAPPWAPDPPPGRIRLEITPGMVCGTGYHPCTQLCLEAMERHLVPDSTVLDVGSGSGILSKAAALLGSGLVIGCDIDSEAIRIASTQTHVPMFVGSVSAIRSGVADLIVANISAEAVDRLWEEFKRVAKPRHTLIFSGFQADEIEASWRYSERSDREGWACVVVRNP